MIAVDTSALIAILRLEPEADSFLKIVTAKQCVMSALSLLETSMVMCGSARSMSFNPLEEFIAAAEIEIVPFDAHQAVFARSAFLRFGKGRHPAALNLGDCASYALAATRSLPLLFKGEDFSKTDLTPALPVG